MVLVEVRVKSYLASMVPVIVNAILDQHQLVVDIVAFVGKGDFPRSRLGEKQRGKILASWVTRKMRTIAQFGIRDMQGTGRDGGGGSGGGGGSVTGGGTGGGMGGGTGGSDFGGGGSDSRRASLMTEKPQRASSFLSLQHSYNGKEDTILESPTRDTADSQPAQEFQFAPLIELPTSGQRGVELPVPGLGLPATAGRDHDGNHGRGGADDLGAPTPGTTKTRAYIVNPDPDPDDADTGSELAADPRLAIPATDPQRQSVASSHHSGIRGNIHSVADFDWADGYYR